MQPRTTTLPQTWEHRSVPEHTQLHELTCNDLIDQCEHEGIKKALELAVRPLMHTNIEVPRPRHRELTEHHEQLLSWRKSCCATAPPVKTVVVSQNWFSGKSHEQMQGSRFVQMCRRPSGPHAKKQLSRKSFRISRGVQECRFTTRGTPVE